jgi:hypothetical protein
MARNLCRWLLLALWTAIAVTAATPISRGQDGSPQGDSPGTTDAETLPKPTRLPDVQPPAFVLPTPDYNVPPAPSIHHPLLERPEAEQAGLFCNVESSVLFPVVQNKLQGGMVTLAQTSGASPQSAIGLPPGAGMPITGDIVNFPGPRFNAGYSPRFELGYRFSRGLGEIRLGYRFLDARGIDTALVVNPNDGINLGPAAQTGRLALNFIDLDYATREFSIWPNWEMRWAVGVRYATSFYDSRVTFFNPVTQMQPFGTAPFTLLSQYEALADRFIGAHAVLEVDRRLPVAGLALFGRLEGSGLYGRAHQTFTETFVQDPHFSYLRVTNGLGSPIVAGQVGFTYDIPRWNHSRVLVGYQAEGWWQFGRGDNDLSFGTLYDQGLFLRAEFNF